MVIKHKGVLPCLGKLSLETPTANNVGIKHLVESGLYNSSEKDILLRNHAADGFDKMTTSLLHSTKIRLIDTPEFSFISFIFAIWSKTKRRIRSLRCF